MSFETVSLCVTNSSASNSATTAVSQEKRKRERKKNETKAPPSPLPLLPPLLKTKLTFQNFVSNGREDALSISQPNVGVNPRKFVDYGLVEKTNSQFDSLQIFTGSFGLVAEGSDTGFVDDRPLEKVLGKHRKKKGEGKEGGDFPTLSFSFFLSFFHTHTHLLFVVFTCNKGTIK